MHLKGNEKDGPNACSTSIVFSSVFQIVNHKQFKGFSLAITQIILLKVHAIVSTTIRSEFGNKYLLNFTKEVQR